MPSIRQRFHLSPCSDFRSHFFLTGLVVALFMGIDKLIDVAMSLKNGNGGFAEGMILTAIIGVITTFLSSITLIVKGLVDSLTSRKSGDK